MLFRMTSSSPTPDTWFLTMVRILNLLTILAGGLGVLSNALLLFLIPAPASAVGLRIYALLLALVVALTETEWPRLFHWVGLLETWPGRGAVAVLAGILLLEFDQSVTGREYEEEALSKLFRSFAAHFLIVMGVIYFVAGIACLHRVKQEQISRLRKKEQMQKEKQDLETRKHEIEMLLRDTESQLEKI